MPGNVLIVEDSPEVRSGLQIALESKGYKVRSAGDGREGIKLFREWRPDIALLDIRMPRLSGIDVCTLIRHESDVPVIMYSGVDEPGDVQLAIQRGANDYVLKDTGFRELLSRVGKHMRLRVADMVTTRGPAARGRVLPFSSKQSGIATTGQTGDAGITPFDDDGTLENVAVVAHSEPKALNELASITARTGFEVVTASTGQETVGVLALRRPRLVIVGNVLTDMSCIGVIKEISEHPAGAMIAVVLALGRRAPELARRARYLGVHETVVGPWSDGRLDIAIRGALAETRNSRPDLQAA